MAPVADTITSYIAHADAVSYFDTRLHSSVWLNASEDDQNRALIQSTRILDTYVEWYETIDRADAESVPDILKHAVCELAVVILGKDPQAVDSMYGIAKLTVEGAVTIEKDKEQKAQIIPTHVWAMIRHLGDKKGVNSSIEIVRSL